MNRLIIIIAAAFLMGVGSTAFAAPTDNPAASRSRAPYDPFAMSRASQAEPGSRDFENFRRRQEIAKRMKARRMRPPHHPGNRSPHQPGEPFHDRDGDGVEDHGGHGPNNNPGNPPPFTPPGGGTGTNPGGNTTGPDNANNGNGRGAPGRR